MFEYLLGGAGSHKTTRLCEKALAFLKSAGGHPSRLVLTTYAREAANQLLDRVRSLVLRDTTLSWKEKQEIVTGLDAATIGTNHSLGRAALEQHWLELGKTPAADVIDEATRRDFVAAAIGAVPLAPTQRRQLDEVALRLGRSETETRAPGDPRETVNDDIRALVDMISDLGITGAEFVRECMASVNLLCNELDRHRQVRGVTVTLPAFIAHAAQAAQQLAMHPKGNTGATRDARLAMEAFVSAPTWNKLDPLVTIEAYSRVTRNEPITPDATIVEPLRQAARNYHLFPEFAADLRAYVEMIAGIAAQVHQEYRRLVAETNRVDFADMEQALRDLLGDPSRRKAFCSRFGYIGSDESQDMTARTAEAFKLVTQEVGAGAWLADPNQSIYPFRGADHEAVHQAARDLLATLSPGTGPTTHGQNHRSPAGIIRFVNDLFHSLSLSASGQTAGAAPVRALPLPHAQDAPPAAKTPQAPPGRIERWLLTEGSIEKRFAQLADGVERLINRPKDPIAPEEICIMVRTNAGKKKAAAAFAARGIKAALRSTTLFESREARVILSALGLIVDDRDTLAEATLRYLLDEQLPGATANADFNAWLVERIHATAAKQTGTEPAGATSPSAAWKEALMAARTSRATTAFSPVSAVLLAIEATGVIGRIAAWGDSLERQSHIDSLIGLARNYEKRAKAAGRPATVAGFVAMCNERADQEAHEASGGFSSRGSRDDDFDSDTPPKDHRGVRIMTCHATKGLGYRVTIVADFKLPGRGLSPFEITTLGRKPHVWPNPLKGRVNDDLDTIARSLLEGQQRYHKKLEAEGQLLYVAFTRSEGELVVAHSTKEADTNWLPTVFGPSNLPTSPAGIDHFLPTDTAATQVVHTQPAPPLPSGASGPLTAVAEYAYVDDLTMPAAGRTAAEAATATPIDALESALPRPLTSVSHPPRYRSPSDYHTTTGPWRGGESFIPIPLAGTSQPDLVTGGFKKAAASKADALGEAFHSFMAAIPSLPPLTAGDAAAQQKARTLWEKVAARCLGGFLGSDDVAAIAAAGLTPAVMIERGQAFVEWCVTEFVVSPADWIVEAGVSGPANAAIGGTWRGRADLVFVARSGTLAGKRVLVDHKAVMATGADCVRKADEYLGEVTAYAEALDTPGSQSLTPDAIYIHFPLAAAIVPLVNATPETLI